VTSLMCVHSEGEEGVQEAFEMIPADLSLGSEQMVGCLLEVRVQDGRQV
jgi:hypothetical protein